MATNPPLSGLSNDEGAFAMAAGLVLGTGSARVVTEYIGHPGLVIKVSFRPTFASNWKEWLLWNQIEDEQPLAAIFGKCVAMSVSGKYLVMERLDDLNTAQAAQRFCPPWITDRKPSAFGLNAAGEVKLRDYAQQVLGFFLAQFPLVKV
jgi:hypothetical protein